VKLLEVDDDHGLHGMLVSGELIECVRELGALHARAASGV
jgi:hypothetical protein